MWSHSNDKKIDLDVNNERSSIKIVSGQVLKYYLDSS